MATLGNRSKEIAIMGKKLVKSHRVLGNNSHESTISASATSPRAIHSMYDKNLEGHIRPALVPDEVVNSPHSGKYWVPHHETGVFVPSAEQSSASGKVVRDEGGKTVMEVKAWFRPTGLEDLEKPHC